MIGRIGKQNCNLLRKIGINCFWWDTVDYVIDRIRKKYNVFVSIIPTMDDDRICYNANITYTSQRCTYLCYAPTKIYWNPNIYEVKRQGIRAAAKWILAHKCKKVSIKSAKK